MRDLRTRALRPPAARSTSGYFQRTRAGQLISAIITEVDQTKTVVTASLVSLFQNLVVVATTLVLLSQISVRLTLLTLAVRAAPGARASDAARRLRRHSRARAARARRDHGHVTERIGAVRLVRAYGEEARESDPLRRPGRRATGSG